MIVSLKIYENAKKIPVLLLSTLIVVLSLFYSHVSEQDVLANTTRASIVAEARKWVDVTDMGSANHHALIDYYNSFLTAHPEYLDSRYCGKANYNTDWCAIFVSVVAMKCNATDVIFPESACWVVPTYQANGTWVENDAYVPSPGDLIFYNWDDSGSGDCTGDPYHVGIVESCNGSTITTIEGNTTIGDQYNVGVHRRTISVNGRYIRGYAVPRYSETPANITPVGSVDGCEIENNSHIHIAGWAYDPDEPSKSLSIHVYVNNTFVKSISASYDSSDVNKAYNISGKHRFGAVFDAGAVGDITIDIYAVDSQGGSNTLLGEHPYASTHYSCHIHTWDSGKVTKQPSVGDTGTKEYTCTSCGKKKTETLPALVPTNIAPVGSIDGCEIENNSQIHIAGWAYDPDEPSESLSIYVYVNNKFVKSISASYDSPDVNKAYNISGKHRFGDVFDAGAVGDITIDIYAIDSQDGSKTLIGEHPYAATHYSRHIHSWDSGKVTKQPGVGTTGTKEFTCTACGKTETETIPALVSMSSVSVSVSNVTYTGSELKPSVTVTYNSKTLVSGTDYTVSYSNNVNVGKATVTVTGKGTYSGTKTENFTINAKSLSNLTFSSISDQNYTGTAIVPAVTIKDGSKTLIKDTDYTVAYSNNVNIGKATVTITGKSNYTGTKTFNFSIIGLSYTWEKSSGNWYLYDNNGTMITGWKQLDGVWYYLGANGSMTTGWQQIGGKWYYFELSGAMVTNWKSVSDKWYYFNNSGAMVTGWQKIGGVWYYFESSGAMTTGWKQIAGKWYYLKKDGSMASDEYCDGYYLNPDGTWTYEARASWKKDSKGWYYKDNTGWYARNQTLKIDGKIYNFNSSGYCTNP